MIPDGIIVLRTGRVNRVIWKFAQESFVWTQTELYCKTFRYVYLGYIQKKKNNI
jgi:hypothetical protein